MNDYMIRMSAAEGNVRAFAASTGGVVEEARRIHNTSPVVTAALGRLLTAGLLMGSQMKDDEDRITLKIDGDGPMRGELVTADCRGHVKGYPYEADVILPPNAKGKLDVGGAVGRGTLTVISDLGLKEPYVGSVDLVSGEIAEDIAQYYAMSEQVPSAVGLGVLMKRENTVNCAGGFIIQLLPGCPEKTVSALEKNLRGIDSVTDFLRRGDTPEEMLSSLLDGLNPVITSRMPVQYFCGCTRTRVENALSAVGAKELSAMIAENKPAELSCHFCGKKYLFSVDDLKQLLAQAKGNGGEGKAESARN